MMHLGYFRSLTKVGSALIWTLASMPLWATSSYQAVKDVIYSNEAPLETPQVASELQVYKDNKLPHYPMNLKSIFGSSSQKLEQDAKRTVNETNDYYNRIQKLLHPNGVCVFGVWKMNAAPLSDYTGAFSAGSEHLFIGRVSVAMQETEKGSKRGFGFAGKLFANVHGSSDMNAVVETQNFFSVDVLNGSNIDRFLDTATTNEPAVGFSLLKIYLGLKIASSLKKADESPTFRPLTNLAQLDGATVEQARHPKWIRISADSKMLRNDEADFRDEVTQALHANKELVFNVDGSDSTHDRNSHEGWHSLGQIHISESVTSYGCDRRLHFAHPKLH